MDKEKKYIGKILESQVSIEEIKNEFNVEKIRVVNYTMPIEFYIDWNRLNIIVNDENKIIYIIFG